VLTVDDDAHSARTTRAESETALDNERNGELMSVVAYVAVTVVVFAVLGLAQRLLERLRAMTT
jgi:hypothetical protein